MPKCPTPLINAPKSSKIIAVLGVGVLAVSTAAIWIRLAISSAGVSGVGFSLVLAASRLTLASLLLIPTWHRVPWRQISRSAIVYALAAGVFLAVHFATWITSLSYTSIAAATTLVTSNPLWVTLLSWLWFGEKPTFRTVLGIAIALTGGILISVGGTAQTATASNPLLGNFLALVGAWTVSFYLLLGREAQRQGLGLGGYGIVAYGSAALVLLPLPGLFGASYAGFPPVVYFYILMTALLPQLVGHTSINWAVRWVSPTLITLMILFEPVCASILGYWIFGEVPTFWVLVGAVVLLMGVAIAALGARSRSG
ncbi:MAG: DMT family transporter [Geitlerinemataceae cyanobacterium]